MPLSHVSKVFAVKDAKVRKMTADPSGGTTTLAASVDVPGIKTVTISGDLNTAELRGDNTRLDYQSVLAGISVEFEYAKLAVDILPVVLGGAVVDSGTTPNQLTTFGLTSLNAGFSFFEFEAQAFAADTIGGDATIKLYKCILDSFPDGLGMAEEDYMTFTMSAQALPRLSDNKWLDVVLRETAVALP
jgi:hypothetical protein